MVYLEILAVPNAQRSQAMGWQATALRVRLAAPPDKGKANDELIRYLSKALAVPKGAITITAGHGSRHKRLAIAGIDMAAVYRAFPQ